MFEPAGTPVDPTSDAPFDGLTTYELTMLLNRYEQLAQSEMTSLTDDWTAIESTIWHDFIEGPVSPYIDRVRSSAEGRRIQLRSGEIIRKAPGVNVWTLMNRSAYGERDPVVIVSIVEPAGLTLVIDNSDHAGARHTPELSAISKHFK
jgi:hypothetical protein